MTNKDNNAIFITGSSSGLGRAAAKLFASKGWKVIASMREPKEGKGIRQHFWRDVDGTGCHRSTRNRERGGASCGIRRSRSGVQ